VTRKPALEAWQQALELADGDPRRLRVLDDGTVLVSNVPGGHAQGSSA
jgi:hypothetical protein